MQYLKQAIQIVNRTQRQTFIYVYVKEGDTNVKSDLIKCMPETSIWNYGWMDSGDLISKAVFAAWAFYAKELTMQPCSLYTEANHPGLRISRSSSTQLKYYLQISHNLQE